ncbi:MAG: glycogen-binding domain-containing protein [Deltaproteobacteria bacterium]
MKKTTVSTKAAAPKAKSLVFKFHSPKAKKVSVAGDFNNWDTCGLSGKKDTKGNWSIKVALKPGRYEYKFFVDGSWINDPATPAVTNIYGSQNSVIEVK